MEKVPARKLAVFRRDEYDWFTAHGGGLSISGYSRALQVPREARFYPSTLSQAESMYKLIPLTGLGKLRRYVSMHSTVRMYSWLREPFDVECCGWSDQKIFAEVLLLQHHLAANLAFVQLFPNIFHRNTTRKRVY